MPKKGLWEGEGDPEPWGREELGTRGERRRSQGSAYFSHVQGGRCHLPSTVPASLPILATNSQPTIVLLTSAAVCVGLAQSSFLLHDRCVTSFWAPRVGKEQGSTRPFSACPNLKVSFTFQAFSSVPEQPVYDSVTAFASFCWDFFPPPGMPDPSAFQFCRIRNLFMSLESVQRRGRNIRMWPWPINTIFLSLLLWLLLFLTLRYSFRSPLAACVPDVFSWQFI